jgi:hypothetical protein
MYIRAEGNLYSSEIVTREYGFYGLRTKANINGGSTVLPRVKCVLPASAGALASAGGSQNLQSG